METAIAADIEHAGAGQIRGQRRSNVLPLHVGKIAQEVMGRRPNAIEVDVVEPITFFRDTACEFLVAVQDSGTLITPTMFARVVTICLLPISAANTAYKVD